jgi:hypothetical protein
MASYSSKIYGKQNTLYKFKNGTYRISVAMLVFSRAHLFGTNARPLRPNAKQSARDGRWGESCTTGPR